MTSDSWMVPQAGPFLVTSDLVPVTLYKERFTTCVCVREECKFFATFTDVPSSTHAHVK